MEKWPIFHQNHGLTPWEKSQFLDFFNFLFLQAKNAFFVLRKSMEKWPIFDENHGLTPLQKSQFFDFLNLLFLYPREAYFSSKIKRDKLLSQNPRPLTLQALFAVPHRVLCQARYSFSCTLMIFVPALRDSASIFKVLQMAQIYSIHIKTLKLWKKQ